MGAYCAWQSIRSLRRRKAGRCLPGVLHANAAPCSGYSFGHQRTCHAGPPRTAASGVCSWGVNLKARLRILLLNGVQVSPRRAGSEASQARHACTRTAAAATAPLPSIVRKVPRGTRVLPLGLGCHLLHVIPHPCTLPAACIPCPGTYTTTAWVPLSRRQAHSPTLPLPAPCASPPAGAHAATCAELHRRPAGSTLCAAAAAGHAGDAGGGSAKRSHQHCAPAAARTAGPRAASI